jgi:NADH-quinone oxidoreductase subunit C
MNKEIPQVQQDLENALKSRFPTQLKPSKPHAWLPYGLSFEIARENLLEVMKALKTEDAFKIDMLIDVTCVDWMDQREERFEIVYQLLSVEKMHRLCLKAVVPEQDCKIESVISIWPVANFLEREVWDMYGVVFSNHGDLRRILMYDEFEGHPLRKDYPILKKQPRIPLRMPELHNTSKDMQRQQLVGMPTRKHGENKAGGV